MSRSISAWTFAGAVTAFFSVSALVSTGALTRLVAQHPARRDVTLSPQTSGTDQLLIGVSPVDENTAWVSGTGGTFLRTEDGGDTWMVGVVPGADSLQFRDVHALDTRTAWLLAAGTGDASRVYRTTDGGRSWTLQFTNQEPAGFYDWSGFLGPEERHPVWRCGRRSTPRPTGKGLVARCSTPESAPADRHERLHHFST